MAHARHGGAWSDYKLNPAEVEIVEQSIRAFPTDIAGFEYLFGSEGLTFTEVNLAPYWGGEASVILEPLQHMVRTLDGYISMRTKSRRGGNWFNLQPATVADLGNQPRRAL